MRRRNIISLFGTAAVLWPVGVRAQPAAIPVVGYLSPGTPEATAYIVAAFHKGLSEGGYVEASNVAMADERRQTMERFGATVESVEPYEVVAVDVKLPAPA